MSIRPWQPKQSPRHKQDIWYSVAQGHLIPFLVRGVCWTNQPFKGVTLKNQSLCALWRVEERSVQKPISGAQVFLALINRFGWQSCANIKLLLSCFKGVLQRGKSSYEAVFWDYGAKISAVKEQNTNTLIVKVKKQTTKASLPLLGLWMAAGGLGKVNRTGCVLAMPSLQMINLLPPMMKPTGPSHFKAHSSYHSFCKTVGHHLSRLHNFSPTGQSSQCGGLCHPKCPLDNSMVLVMLGKHSSNWQCLWPPLSWHISTLLATMFVYGNNNLGKPPPSQKHPFILGGTWTIRLLLLHLQAGLMGMDWDYFGLGVWHAGYALTDCVTLLPSAAAKLSSQTLLSHINRYCAPFIGLSKEEAMLTNVRKQLNHLIAMLRHGCWFFSNISPVNINLLSLIHSFTPTF